MRTMSACAFALINAIKCILCFSKPIKIEPYRKPSEIDGVSVDDGSDDGDQLSYMKWMNIDKLSIFDSFKWFSIVFFIKLCTHAVKCKLNNKCTRAKPLSFLSFSLSLSLAHIIHITSYHNEGGRGRRCFMVHWNREMTCMTNDQPSIHYLWHVTIYLFANHNGIVMDTPDW